MAFKRQLNQQRIPKKIFSSRAEGIMHLSSRNNSNERDMLNLQQLNVPFYESTKGTNSEERTLLMKRLASTAEPDISMEGLNVCRMNALTTIEPLMSGISQWGEEQIINPEQISSSEFSETGQTFQTKNMENTYFHQNNEMISSQLNQQHELIQASIHRTTVKRALFTPTTTISTEENRFQVPTGNDLLVNQQDGRNQSFGQGIEAVDILATLQERLQIYNKQRLAAQKAGHLSLARRKLRRIQQYKDAIKKIKEGDTIDFNSLPDPTNGTSPLRKTLNKPSVPSSDISEEEISHKNNPSSLPSVKDPVKRKKNYCIYCLQLVSKFSEHIEAKHPDSELGEKLKYISGTGKERRAKKMEITNLFRKKWNALFNQKVADGKTGLESGITGMQIITVKKRNKDTTVPNVKCLHCLGMYRKDKLFLHLKKCEPYLKSISQDNLLQVVPALKQHSEPNLPTMNYVTEPFKECILKGVRLDNVMEVAIHDPLIMKFGSEFHESRRAPSDKDYVIREIRDLARLFMEMKLINPNLQSFKDIFNPVNFATLVQAALKMAKYNQDTGNVEVSSIAYRLSQPLKDAAIILKTEAMASLYKQDGCVGSRSTVTMVDDFLDLMSKKWKSKIGRICSKSQKTTRIGRIEKMALEDDIIKVAAFIQSRYRSALKALEEETEKKDVFDNIIHMVVVHIMLLIRRRPVDFKHATVQHYNNIDKHDELIEMVKGYDLTEENLNDCKRFHIFYVPGKNLEIVPILLTVQMKNVLDTVLCYRKNVNIKSNLLFSLSEGRKIKPTESLKLIKRQINHLRKPEHLTGNGLRHQAATFSRLQSSHPQYQDYLASTLGHTLAVHKKHYELPMGIIQKIMVCPILHGIMTGEARKQKSTSKAILPPEIHRCENSFENTKETSEVSNPENVDIGSGSNSVLSHPSSTSSSSEDEGDRYEDWKKCRRTRWTTEEQEVVLTEFGPQILKKEPPSRSDVAAFLTKNPQIAKNRSIDQVVMYIRNHAKRSQKNVTPKVKKFLKANKN